MRLIKFPKFPQTTTKTTATRSPRNRGTINYKRVVLKHIIIFYDAYFLLCSQQQQAFFMFQNTAQMSPSLRKLQPPLNP